MPWRALARGYHKSAKSPLRQAGSPLRYNQKPMNGSPHPRPVDEVSKAASELEGEARKRYLDEHCPDAAFRQEVEAALAATPQLEPGSRLGHYEIRAKIGSGGMGWVYEARDTRLQRVVAIKVLPPVPAGGDDPANRLAREAQAA